MKKNSHRINEFTWWVAFGSISTLDNRLRTIIHKQYCLALATFFLRQKEYKDFRRYTMRLLPGHITNYANSILRYATYIS